MELSKKQLRVAELQARAEDLRAEGCERLADIMEAWAIRLESEEKANA